MYLRRSGRNAILPIPMSALVSPPVHRSIKAVPSLMSAGSRCWLPIPSIWIMITTGSAANRFRALELAVEAPRARAAADGMSQARDGDGRPAGRPAAWPQGFSEPIAAREHGAQRGDE